MKTAAIVVIGFLLSGIGLTTASATPVKTTVVAPQCVPRDAVEYQPAVYETKHYNALTETVYDRYSWTPGNHDNEEDAPDVTGSTPTSDPEHWQVNQKPDPTDDPIGVAFQAGQGDNASWFFWLGSEEVVTDAYDEQVLVKEAVEGVEAVYCQIGLYVYKKLNSAAPASWSNSGPQTFIASKDGTAPDDWYTGIESLPEVVCGDGWGYQQDATKSATPVDLANAVIEYPNFTVGWPPIYAAKHGELSDLIEVPECAPELLEVTPPPLTPDVICGPDNDAVTIPEVDGVTYSDTGWVEGERTITATATKGHTLIGTTSWTFTDKAIACPFEVTAFAASVVDPPVCGPNNDMVTIPELEGVTYSDTGWVEGERTITATATKGYTLIGTTSWTFTDKAIACPFEVTAFAASVVDPPVCGPNNDVLDIPEQEGVTYSDTGWVDNERTITATANRGYVLVGQSSWTFTDQATPCDAFPPAPTVVAKCFPNNDTVTIPEVEGVVYADTGWVGGKRTITASPAGESTFFEDVSWTFTDVPSTGCPPVGPVFAADELAFTGTSSNTGGFVALAILLVTSGAALVTRKRRAF